MERYIGIAEDSGIRIVITEPKDTFINAYKSAVEFLNNLCPEKYVDFWVEAIND